MSGAYRSRRGASRTTINEDTDSSEEESDGGSRPGTPRTRHSVAKKNAEQLTLQLLTHLERHKIDGMRSRFQEHDLRVSMLDFVRIMRDALPNYIVRKPGEQGKKKSAAELAGLRILDDEEDLLRNLLELYREIDVNGDGDVEWEEFIRFIVDKAQVFKEMDRLDTIPNYEHILLPSDVQAHQQRLKEGRATAAPPPPKHRHMIDSLVRIPDQGLLAVAEQHSAIVQFYDMASGSKKVKNDFRAASVPLAMTYVQEQQSLVLCCSDQSMAQWSLTPGHGGLKFSEKARWTTPDTIMCLAWSDGQRLAFGGCSNGDVEAWDLERRERASSLRGHTDIVLDVLHVPYLDTIVSGSLDRTVRVWDPFTEQMTANLKGGHTKGVNALTYNQEHRFLVSTGFDHDAFVWSPFATCLLYTLKGHKAALVNCHAVEGTHELITADNLGVMKLWDLRTFGCIQTFQTEHTKGDLADMTGFQALTHVKLKSKDPTQSKPDYRVVCATKDIFFFDQYRTRVDPVTDDLPPRIMCLNDVNLTLFVSSQKSVKIFDLILGTRKATFRNVTDAGISAACLDDRRRKFFVGTNTGQMSCHNYANGALMKRFSKLDARVIAMRYDHGGKRVIAASLSGRTVVYDEQDIEHCYPLRTFDEPYQHRKELSHVVLHEGGGLCATTSTDSVEGIRFWSSDQASIDSQLCTRGQVIMSMGFLEPYPLLWVATSDGRIRIWGTPTKNEKTGKLDNSKVNGCCLLSFGNVPSSGSYYEFVPEEGEVALHQARRKEAEAKLKEAESIGDEDAMTKYAELLEKVDPDVGETPVKSPHQPRPTLYPAERPRSETCTYGEPTATGLPAGVETKAVPVATAQFDAFSGHFYMGDELGNVRCFDVSLVIRLLQDGVPSPEYAVKTSTRAPLYAEACSSLGEEWGRESRSSFYEPVFAADKIDEPWDEVATVLGAAWRSTFPDNISNEAALCSQSALEISHVLVPANIRAYEVQHRRPDEGDAWQLDDVLRSERRSVGRTDFLAGPAGGAPLLPVSLARFCWSVEYAHEDAVLALACARDPACVLTSGLDRCVRMWSHAGCFRGVLLQGYAVGSQSPFWSLEVDVAAREARDDAEAKRVAADLAAPPLVVAQLQEARALAVELSVEPELSPRLVAVRAALSDIQAMGSVDQGEAPAPPGSPASTTRSRSRGHAGVAPEASAERKGL